MQTMTAPPTREEDLVGPDDPTTGAELRTIRDALGLPLDWVAHHTGVSPGQLRQWEAERKTKRPPRNVAAHLWRLLEGQEDYIDTELDRLTGGDPAPARLTLLRFRGDGDAAAHGLNMPATTHGIAQLRIARALEEDGIQTRMIWFNPAEYGIWLDQQPETRHDSPQMQQTWAESIDWPAPQD